ncbi:tetratricopeptide repeat protein [Candidatus Peribacteria bacterium]|nr:tetratricopeptide repeat protein [Candidatus Peribacteria bacterium]
MRRTVLLTSGACLLLTFLTFGRSLSQNFAPLDDDLLITHNLAVRGVTAEHLKTVFTTYDPELYIPLTFVSYQVNYMIGGLEPWIYHVTNILLHAGNALLVMCVMMLLLRMQKGVAVLHPYIMVFAGLIFAIHPLNTEAVVWLAGRKDVLSTMFFLLAYAMYLQYRGRGTACRALTTAYWFSIIFFTLALLSKVMAVTLPAILILTDILIERRKWVWRMLIDKIPYAILSGIFFVIAAAGKERILAEHSLWEMALMAAKSTVFYLQKFLLPSPLGVFYPYRGEISLFLPAFFVPIIILVLLAALLITAARYRAAKDGSTSLITGGRAGDSRGILFGSLFFLLTLAPTFINFHKGGEMYFASDRYMYLPQVGLLFLLVMMGDMILEKGAAVLRPYKGPWMWLATPIIAILAIMSFQQTRIWDSASTLFGHTLALSPESVAARSALAMMDKDTGKYDHAIKLLRDGIAFGDHPELRMGLCSVYAKIGRVEDAAEQCTQASQLDPTNPEPLVGLGVLEEYEGKTADAMVHYRKAVEMDSSYVSARNKLGSLLLEAGETAEAEAQFRAALQWNPNAEGVLYNLSLILDGQGKLDESLASLEKANELSPDSVMIMTALAGHLLTSNPSRARALLTRVLRIDAKNMEAVRLLRSLDTL